MSLKQRLIKLLGLTDKTQLMRADCVYRYSGTLVFIALYLWLGVYPLLVAYMNPIPTKQELVNYQVKIIEVNKNDSTITLELPDKTIQYGYFPVGLYFITMGTVQFYGLSDIELVRLKSCEATVGAKRIKWLIPERYMVWDLNCRNVVRYGFTQAVNDYKRGRSGVFGWIESIIHTSMLIFLYFLINKERNE